MKKIVQDACRIEKKLQVDSGLIIIQDPSNPLHWETSYFLLTTADDPIITPPPNAPTEPASEPRHDDPGLIIDLTVSDDERPLVRKVRSKAEVVVKQEIVDENVAAKVTDKGKGVVKPAKDGATGGGNFKVAAKSYSHGDGNTAAKITKAEMILSNIADGLSPEAQEKREISRMNLFRESLNQDRRDRLADERMQELKAEIQALKKEIENLRQENALYRDRATEAITTLNVLRGTNHSFGPIQNPATAYMPTIPAFATNPSLYSMPSVNCQLSEPEGIAGPGPQTLHNRQQAAEYNDSKALE